MPVSKTMWAEQNSLKYDENGRLWKVFPTEDSTGYGYKFEYDKFGNLAASYLVEGTSSQELTSRRIDYAANTVTEWQYRGGSADKTEIKLDNYGRTVTINLQRGNELSESASFARAG